MRKFSKAEQQEIRVARSNHPGTSQRGLATIICDNIAGTYPALKTRSRASVYSAIRRHDRETVASRTFSSYN